MLTSSTGNKVPLGQVATPEWTLDDPVIWRQRLPFITVQSDTAPGVRAETVSSALSQWLPVSENTAGYSVEEGGVVVESEKQLSVCGIACHADGDAVTADDSVTALFVDAAGPADGTVWFAQDSCGYAAFKAY
jgi:hypothetical protein